MRMVDIIAKKRDGAALSEEEIRWMIASYTREEIPDYQMSAFLMAVVFSGMNDEETAILTDAMAGSGDRMDLSSLPGVKVDKHSTGGVGDKTTLIVAPIAAACGCTVAKMSGRGLGHTGGTVDKLESIPGMRTSLSTGEFLDVVRRTRIAVTGQTGNLAPADKKIYALRDVTATVDSIPLIASSIMSKKLAVESDCIVLDVKTGSGAFMKTEEDSILLAQKMVAIGIQNGRKMAALITDMDIPLGFRIGNTLEVEEAIHTLRGEGPEDLQEICLALSSEILRLAGNKEEDCPALALKAIQSGAAFEKFVEMVEAQGGDSSFVRHPEKLRRAAIEQEVKAPRGGWINKMDTAGIGTAAMLLGAGRESLESRIDPLAGIILEKKTGDAVRKGETIARLLTSESSRVRPAEERFLEAIDISDTQPKKKPLIRAVVTEQGVVRTD